MTGCGRSMKTARGKGAGKRLSLPGSQPDQCRRLLAHKLSPNQWGQALKTQTIHLAFFESNILWEIPAK